MLLYHVGHDITNKKNKCEVVIFPIVQDRLHWNSNLWAGREVADFFLGGHSLSYSSWLLLSAPWAVTGQVRFNAPHLILGLMGRTIASVVPSPPVLPPLILKTYSLVSHLVRIRIFALLLLKGSCRKEKNLEKYKRCEKLVTIQRFLKLESEEEEGRLNRAWEHG